MPRTILVSNRLPIRLNEDGDPERTTGGLASALAGSGIEALWVGWPGVAADEITDREKMRSSMDSLGVVPVVLTQEELEGYYDGYSNGTIWPLVHYMLERARFETPWFPLYEQANQKFAEVVLSVAVDGDNIWIHDYHLFLLPRLLRESGKSFKIGFFLHTPFPSSEIFRTLPERNAILHGLLGADLIGFHTFNYLRHFRSAVLRALGIESEVDKIRQENRDVILGVYPIGHDHRGFMNAVETSEYEQALERHGSELQGKKLILSVERLDYTKGIPQKLDAIRLYLETHPDLALKVVFVIIAVPSRGGNEEYAQLTERVQREVGSINGDFGTVGHAPVQLLYRSFPQPELAALYGLADVCLVTPLIDGMNLVAKEYIDCKTEHPKIRPGVLVLSEFAGAAPEMSHAVLVNPYDVLETAQAIHDALEMEPEERKERSRAMQGHLRRTDASVWASRFMNDLKSVPSSEQQIADLRLEGLARNLAARVNAGERVALALDYDGTLRSFVSHPDDAVPDVDLCPLLSSIAKHPLIDVAVVSGRPAEFLEKHFAGLGITLVAEHGYRWLRPDTKHWALVHEHIDTDWKADVLPHLEQAVRLTPGSHMEEKQSSIVWHYRRADPEFGLWRARGLLDELTDVTASLPVAVHHGKKIVEVASQLVNKGQAVKALVNDWQPSVLLAAGDDQTDETMFALELDSLEFITVNVGNGPTRAERRTNIKGLRQSLENLAALLK